MKNTLLTGATRFAHLMRGAAPAVVAAQSAQLAPQPVPGAKAEDDQDMMANGDAEDGDEGEDDEAKADDGEGDGKKGKKGKKSKKDPGDDDDDDDGDDDADDGDRKEARADGLVRAARLRERSRCAAIFGHPAAAANLALAAALAFETDLSRNQAITVLATGGSPAASRLANRMAVVPATRIGPDGGAEPTGPAAVAARIIASYERAKGLKKEGG